MKKPLISIIVPIYNAESTLKRCVESIYAQTYHNFELILVNDGSTDSSLALCVDLSENSRCKTIIVDKPNGGVSSARNQGLDLAKGEWIYFIDSDDWIEPQYLQTFVDAMNNECVDMIIQSYTVENGNSSKTPRFKHKIFDKNYELIEYLERHPDTHNGFLWHRLFRHSIIKQNGLHFDEQTSYGEDGIFIMQYLRYTHLVIVLPTTGYHYMAHTNSLTYKLYTTDFYFGQLNKFCENLYALSDNEKYHYFIKQYLWRLIETWLIYPSLKHDLKSFDFESLFNRIRKFCSENNMWSVCPTRTVSIVFKLSFLCVYNVKLLYNILYYMKRIENKYNRTFKRSCK